MSKKKTFRIVNLIIAILVCVFALGHAFAWLANEREQKDPWFDGSSGETYFAGGEGTKDKPYLITNQYHLYNLAWLQDMGKFRPTPNAEQNKYYFKLGSNVTITDSDFWLPPIGTDANPFIGEFNGDGYKISNLKITTDKTKLTGSSQSVTFSNAVGMFGLTQKKAGETNGAEIHNFILENPIVEVASQNATYSTAETNKNFAGLAIGYLSDNCKAYSIGVLATQTNGGAKLLVKRDNGYTTFNSIIGMLGDNVSSSVTGGVAMGSGNNGDTGKLIPTDLSSLYNKESTNVVMSSATAFNKGIWVLPKNNTDANGNVTPDSNGIGLGAFSFIIGTTSAMEIRSQSTSSFTYYKDPDKNGIYDTSSENLDIDLSTNYTYGSDQWKIKSHLKKEDGTTLSLNKVLYMENSPEAASSLTGVYETNQNASNYSNSDGAVVYDNCVKVRVKSSSTKIFVIARTSKDAREIGVYKVSNSTEEFDQRVDGYTGSGDSAELYKETFNKETPLMRLKLPVGTDVACEFDLSGDNAGAGTYQINSTKGGVYVYYLAVTGTALGDSGGEYVEPPYNDAVGVSAVDFIYDGVGISTQTDTANNPAKYHPGDFVNLKADGTADSYYTATGTKISFTALQLSLNLAFVRPENGKDASDKTLYVTLSQTTTAVEDSRDKANISVGTVTA